MEDKMPEEEKKVQQLQSLVKDCSFVLNKIEVMKLPSGGEEFNAKNIRGGYVINNTNKVDPKNIKADISLHLSYGDQTKKFFDLECEYTITVTLTQDLDRDISNKGDDAIALFNSSVPYVDATVGPILKTMGYTVK
jgi:hypothetical protein